MDAIIYTSNSGFTKKYAMLLSKLIDVKCYELSNVPKDLKGGKVIYLGWLMAGIIKGYKKALKKYNIVAVCAVGMGSYSDKIYNDLIRQNKIETKAFYLQGGFDITKLSGIYKFMMSFMVRGVVPKIEEKEEKTPEDEMMLDMMKNGKDLVCEENLSIVVDYINKEKI